MLLFYFVLTLSFQLLDWRTITTSPRKKNRIIDRLRVMFNHYLWISKITREAGFVTFLIIDTSLRIKAFSLVETWMSRFELWILHLINKSNLMSKQKKKDFKIENVSTRFLIDGGNGVNSCFKDLHYLFINH